ncbi:MAG TPA: hypothetical protein VGZ47_18910 [Gemmataceae bacterium]|nr:hypothetical protein [Gemmataceae bacterium]
MVWPPIEHPFTSRCLLRRLTALLLCIPIVTAVVFAQAPPANGPDNLPPQNIPVLTLPDCLAIGRSQQPAIQAAQQSLGAAQMAQRGLNEIKFGTRTFAKSVPVRRQQAAWGVNAAAANLYQVQADMDCAVSRMYFSVLYAREQTLLIDDIVRQLTATANTGESLLGKEGAPPDLNPVSLAKARLFLSLAKTKQAEAHKGSQLAMDGLREAMGIGPDCAFEVAADKLPEPLRGVKKDLIVCLAVSRRGEVIQADSAANITNLEIKAQSLTRVAKGHTSAAGGDFHAKPVPTGSFGDEYKPGAIGLDFPTLFVGPKETRMERAAYVNGRAGAVAEKTRNLVALEAAAAFLKWEEAITKMDETKPAAEDGDKILVKLKAALEGNVLQSYKDYLEMVVVVGQVKGQYNEARYNHAVALTEFERVTAGGFPAGITVFPTTQP